MIFYDTETFKYDNLGVYVDTTDQSATVIVNDTEALTEFYEKNKTQIWIGYNNVHYDQYIVKGIMLGMNPKEINDKIIIDGIDGWQISRAFNKIFMVNYDILPVVRADQEQNVGLKKLEGFMGNDIRETDVDFNIDRKLTEEEIDMTIKYCAHDVEQTVEVFGLISDDFEATLSIIKEFNLPITHLQDTEAQLTANAMGCIKQSYDDEFDYFILPCIHLEKYKYVQDWFESKIGNPDKLDPKEFYDCCLKTIIADTPHIFAWGGGHGAKKKIHVVGALYHVDVNNYYPSLLIAWDLVTRAATNNNYVVAYDMRKALKMKQLAATEKPMVKFFKKKQLPYKKMLNSLSGAMKDPKSKAYDPRNNNCMCINGQLMLLMLIEMLEKAFEEKGWMFELIQNNTDGLIVHIDDTDEAFELMDDVCYEWEQICSTDKCEIGLALDCISEIYQGDVNNYLWIDGDGGIESKGAYVKELSKLDYDLPIVNEAIINRLVYKTPVEETINECQDLIKFQKIVKLSSKYEHVEHEHCVPTERTKGVRVIKKYYTYDHTDRYTYKCYRVFASKDISDGRLLKCKTDTKKIPNSIDGGFTYTNTCEKYIKKDKFANTPEHCFIDNGDVKEKVVPDKLDRQWYIDLAKKRLKDKFGVE